MKLIDAASRLSAARFLKGSRFSHWRVARRPMILGLALAIAVGLLGAPQAQAEGSGKKWVGTWSSAMVEAAPTDPTFADQTLRLIVQPGIGGKKVRVRLSNTFGTGTLAIEAASIGLQESGADVVSGSLRELTFGGEAFIVIPAGARVLSDPVDLRVKAGQNLAISLYLMEDSGPPTLHTLAHQTSYISLPGDFTQLDEMPVESETTSWFFLSGVEVLARRKTEAVVTLGDSITEGFGSTLDANTRYPDALQRRLRERFGKRFSVLNAGISGNRVLTDIFGPSASARLDRDVLTESGVEHVILLEGINDIGIPVIGSLFGLPPEALRVVTAEDLIAGYKQIIARARARGLKIYGGTILPYEGAIYFTEEGEAVRQEVNEWIRTSGTYDAVIDFDAVMRDPANPRRLLPAFDVGDNLHPSDAGYQAMADAVDLSLFSDEDDEDEEEDDD